VKICFSNIISKLNQNKFYQISILNLIQNKFFWYNKIKEKRKQKGKQKNYSGKGKQTELAP
jgi:hypothetical protein